MPSDKELFNQHISQQFNDELEEIRTQLLEMGGLVEKQINDAIVALIEGDAKLAQQVRELLATAVRAATSCSWLEVHAAADPADERAAMLDMATLEPVREFVGAVVRHLLSAASVRYKTKPGHAACIELRSLSRDLLRIATRHVKEFTGIVDRVTMQGGEAGRLGHGDDHDRDASYGPI